MDQEYFRHFARRCRELMLRTANERAKEQLGMWAVEFDARAAAPESGDATGGPDIGPPAKPFSPDSPCREATR